MQVTSSHHACMLTVQSPQLHSLSLPLSKARQVLHRFLWNSPEVQNMCWAGHLSGLAEQQWQGQRSELLSWRGRREAGTCVDYGYYIDTASHVSDPKTKIYLQQKAYHNNWRARRFHLASTNAIKTGWLQSLKNWWRQTIYNWLIHAQGLWTAAQTEHWSVHTCAVWQHTLMYIHPHAYHIPRFGGICCMYWNSIPTSIIRVLHEMHIDS